MIEVAKKGAKFKKKLDDLDLRNQARIAGQKWFDDLKFKLEKSGLPESEILWFDNLFKRLLKESVFLAIKAKDFTGDLFAALLKIESIIIPHLYMMPKRGNTIPVLDELLGEVTISEKEYLDEALSCLFSGSMRAPVIMGWSAAIHRIHLVIEKLGFPEFNKNVSEMNAKKSGRFGRFNKKFDISNLNELKASVFDTDILWILEYWNLITKDEHNRLKHCYTMRCNAAHPGGAKITIENIQSFFSDLASIVFRNPKLSLVK